MVLFKFLSRVLIVCFVFSLYSSEMTENNYNTLLTRLKNSIRLGRNGFSIKLEKDRQYNISNVQGQASRKCENPSTESSSEEEINQANHNISDESMFTTGFRDLRFIYEQCQSKMRERLRNKFDGMENDWSKMKEKVISLYNCIKVFSFRQFYDFLSGNVIPISNYLEFIRDVRNEITPQMKNEGRLYDVEILSKNWIDLIMERIEKFLNDHLLKFRIDYKVDEGRGRRRDHRMFAMMMMGFVIMASILVPMGFQFLTVLGGKSLLMAKMALIMSAINGLKKIATSNVGYGLYHAGPEAFHHDPHHHGFHEKIFHIKAQEQPESPFNVVI